MGLFGIERRRQVIDHRIEQRLDTFILERRPYNHRKQLERDGRLAQRRFQFVGGNRFAFQKFMQNFVVVFGDGLDQLCMERLGLFLQIGRNLFRLDIPRPSPRRSRRWPSFR